jgi:2-keto-3-deoxygluconate permease
MLLFGKPWIRRNHMKVLKGIQKIPGGLMVVPLLMGAILNTFAPQALDIGGFTTALFRQGAPTLIAMYMVVVGSMINVKQALRPIYKGTVLTLAKFITGFAIGWGVGLIFGPTGFWSLTPLALIAALTNSNGGLFIALAGEYGDPSDIGGMSILAINDGPFLTMIALGATGMATVPFMSMVSVLIPLLIGFILGNIDDDFRKFLSGGNFLIPFFAFPLGASLDLRSMLVAGLPGIFLGILCTVITGFAGYFATRLYSKRLSPIGAAVGSTAGNAVATPAALALVDPTLEPFVAGATAQIAAAVIVTSILCPLLVTFLYKRQQKKYGDETPGGKFATEEAST